MSDVTIVDGDSLAVMRALPDASFHALVTDPPFGIGYTYDAGREATADPVAYWEWLAPFVAEGLRCLQPGGFVAIWQTQVYFRYFWDWFGPDIHIFAACKNFVQLRPTPITYAYDPIVMFYKPGAEPLRPANPPLTLDYAVANTAGLVSDTKRIEKGHPCPRPYDLCARIVENFTLPGGRVLDPFTGSGTIPLAAFRLGRGALGIECHAPYAAIARQRLAGLTHTGPQLALLPG